MDAKPLFEVRYYHPSSQTGTWYCSHSQWYVEVPAHFERLAPQLYRDPDKLRELREWEASGGARGERTITRAAQPWWRALASRLPHP